MRTNKESMITSKIAEEDKRKGTQRNVRIKKRQLQISLITQEEKINKKDNDSGIVSSNGNKTGHSKITK